MRQADEYNKDITKAAVLYAAGHNQVEISEKLNCHQSSVSRMLNTAEAKRILEQEANKYLNSLSTISESTITQINTTNKIHKAIAGDGELPPLFNNGEKSDIQNCLKYCEITSKREDRILAGHGLIGGSGNQTNYVNNIYNDNRTTNLSTDILQAIGNKLSSLSNDISNNDIIDTE